MISGSVLAERGGMANARPVRGTTGPVLLVLLLAHAGCSGCDELSRVDAAVPDAGGSDAGDAGDAGDASTVSRDDAAMDGSIEEGGMDAGADAEVPPADDEDAAAPEPRETVCADGQCPGAALQLAAYGSYTCALREGSVRCWGDNTHGQLGNRSRLYSASPISVALSEAVTDAFAVQVDAGSDHACARLQSGHVVCWGDSRLGRLGNGVRQWDVRRPVEVEGIDDAVDLAVGPLMSCAVRASGAVECWGDLQAFGSTSEPRPGVETPSVIEGVPKAEQVEVNTRHGCVLTQQGEVYCFGQDALGALGDGVPSNDYEPAHLVPVEPAVAIAVGLAHNCVLHADGGVSCWGRGEEGQLGRPADELYDCGNGLFPSIRCDTEPTRVPGLTGVTALTASRHHTCALNAAGVWCWGDNTLGELGVEGEPTEVPTLVEQAAGAVAIDSSDLRTCALLDTDEVVCWGVQVPPDESVPALIGDDAPVPSVERLSLPGSVGVAAGSAFACVNDAAGAVQCWGENKLGTLGDGEGSRTPRSVPGIDDAVHIATGAAHACAVHANGELSCWGAPTLASFRSKQGRDARPVRLGLSGVTRVAVGDDFTCVLLDGGRVECFGLGTYGQIGSEAVLESCEVGSPFLCGDVAEIPVIDDAVDVVAGFRHACALRQTGEVVCWGADFEEQLGDGQVAHASCPNGNDSCTAKPVKVRTLDDVRALALGDKHTCALRATDELACWGTNRGGQLGVTDTLLADEPVQLPALSDVAGAVAALHSCAWDRYGDVWCWGSPSEFSGSVFLAFDRTPARIEGFERIVTLALGNDHLCAADDRGELYCMGRDDLAQIASTGNADAPRRIEVW